MRVPKVLLKIGPIIDVITLVTLFRDLGLSVEDGMFFQAFNSGRVPMACTKIGKE